MTDRAPRPDYLFRVAARDADPTLWRLAELEEERQHRKLILIASESVSPDPVREVLATSFNNLYTEGYPSWRMTEAENRHWADMTTHMAYFRRYSDLRYYRGCDYANFAESIAQKRIKEVFATDQDEDALCRVFADDIFANVQPLSGAAANNAVYQALIKPGDVVVGMNLVEGGHLTHGSKANRSGKNYKIHSYGISRKTGRIDYDEIARLVEEHQPRMLIGGASAYPWHIDWKRMREIADTTREKCYLLADVAHYAGLIAGKQYPNPIGVADVVSFTTHKSLCGPRGAVILTTDRALAKKVDTAVFPGEQGGPHQGNIAAKAVAFHLASTDTFRELMANVVANSRALAAGIEKRGVKICYGGTDSHLCLVDLNSVKSKTGYRLTGEIAGRILDLVGIVVNKNTVAGDKSAVHPSAIRLGTVWMSQLGYDTSDMDRLAALIVKTVTNIHPFQYIESGGIVSRGKIDLDLLDEIRAEVDALVEGRLGPVSEPSGYPHFDAYGDAGERVSGGEAPALDRGACVVAEPGFGVLEVESERAHYFMQSVGTADVSTLSAGQSTRTFLLDRTGHRIDDVLVMRMEDRFPGWRRYRVLTSAESHARVRRWFRALSDGYALFDDEDVFRKLEGPVMVEDLSSEEPHAGRVGPFQIRSHAEGLPVREAPAALFRPIALLGIDAAQVLGQASGTDVAGGAPGSHSEVTIDGVQCQVASEAGYALWILAPKAGHGKVVAALRTRDAVAGGGAAVDAWRAAQGLPGAGGDAADAKTLFTARPELFGREKTYFVGQRFLPAPPKARSTYAYAATALPLRRTRLYEEHVRLGDKQFLVPFGGWEMPVRYRSIAEEHQSVRDAAGLFDVSHMGVLEVRGESAQRFLDAITSNYVAWLWDGQCQYSYLLDPDGGCIDDILVYRRSYDRFVLVVNAANAEKDEAWIRAAATGDYLLDRAHPWVAAEGPPEIVNLRDPKMGAAQRVDLALQGPRTFDILAAAATDNPRMIDELRQKKRFEFVEGTLGGMDVMISTTGYTGEKVGVEILVHPDRLVELWNLLLERGAAFGIAPCGLGARDSTRIEAGFPLWGHELAGAYAVTPIESGYGSSVKFHKPFFVGRDAMRKHDESRKREIIRFEIVGTGKRLVREGNPIAGGDGKVLGYVTSNTQVGDRQIGLAIVDRRAAIRGKELFMYRLPAAERMPAPRRMDEVEPGDGLVLPDRAVVVKRFL